MGSGPSTRGSARSTGLLVAGGVALIFALTLGVLFARRPAPATPVGATIEPPPDITMLPSGTGVAQGLTGSSDVFVQIVDKHDPTRLEAEIRADRSDPLRAGVYSLTRPRAVLFLRDGRTALIQAARGETTLSQSGSGGRPQQGTLTGDVVVRLYPPTPGRGPDPARDRPLATLRTPVLTFDSALGRLEMPEAIDAGGDAFSFSGTGLIVLFNEPQRRVEQVHLDMLTGPLVVKPAGRAAAEPTTPAPPASPGTAPPAAPAASSPGIPVETLYRAVVGGGIRLTQGQRSLDADDAEAFIRLVDNRLRPGAVALAPAARPQHATILPRVFPASYQPPGPTNAPDATPSPDTDAPIEITWTGPLDVRPVDAAAELARNDVFVRFTSADAGGVRVHDAAAKATGTGSVAEYAATTRDLTLAEVHGGDATAVAEAQGHAAAKRFEASLATGRVHAAGAGMLAGRDPGRQIRWQQDADFELAMERGSPTARPVRAKIAGDVVARDGDALLTGSLVDAEFAPAGRETVLSHILVAGDALVHDGRHGSIRAGTLDVRFEPDADRARPVRLHAAGRVLATRDGPWLTADDLVADIARDDRGRDTPVRVEASGGVRFGGDDGVGAWGDSLTVTPASQFIVLTGNAGACKDLSEIRGQRLLLDGGQRRVRVVGAGTLAHADSQRTLALRWSDALEFDDADGLGWCEGATLAEVADGAVGHDVLAADGLDIALTPATTTAASPSGGASQRELLWARATGTDTRPARAESRRFARTSGGTPELQRLYYLEAPTLRLDQPTGILDVPHAGKMLLVDRRSTPREPGPLGAGTPGGGSGQTLITWNDTMRFDRAGSLVRALGGVRVAHEDAQGAGRVDLECDELRATLREASAATPANAADIRGELAGTTALGRVWMRTAGRELTAGRVDFDAASGQVDALGPGGETVTVLDTRSGVPSAAKRVRWNVRTDRVELHDVQPVVAPR